MQASATSCQIQPSSFKAGGKTSLRSNQAVSPEFRHSDQVPGQAHRCAMVWTETSKEIRLTGNNSTGWALKDLDS